MLAILIALEGFKVFFLIKMIRELLSIPINDRLFEIPKDSFGCGFYENYRRLLVLRDSHYIVLDSLVY